MVPAGTSFVLIGNPQRPNGGFFERWAILGTVPILDATFGAADAEHRHRCQRQRDPRLPREHHRHRAAVRRRGRLPHLPDQRARDGQRPRRVPVHPRHLPGPRRRRSRPGPRCRRRTATPPPRSRRSKTRARPTRPVRIARSTATRSTSRSRRGSCRSSAGPRPGRGDRHVGLGDTARRLGFAVHPDPDRNRLRPNELRCRDTGTADPEDQSDHVDGGPHQGHPRGHPRGTQSRLRSAARIDALTGHHDALGTGGARRLGPPRTIPSGGR